METDENMTQWAQSDATMMLTMEFYTLEYPGYCSTMICKIRYSSRMCMTSKASQANSTMSEFNRSTPWVQGTCR
jgi:hypothetical protein